MNYWNMSLSRSDKYNGVKAKWPFRLQVRPPADNSYDQRKFVKCKVLDSKIIQSSFFTKGFSFLDFWCHLFPIKLPVSCGIPVALPLNYKRGLLFCFVFLDFGKRRLLFPGQREQAAGNKTRHLQLLLGYNQRPICSHPIDPEGSVDVGKNLLNLLTQKREWIMRNNSSPPLCSNC